MPQRTKTTVEHVTFPILADAAGVSYNVVNFNVQLIYKMLEDIAFEAELKKWKEIVLIT